MIKLQSKTIKSISLILLFSGMLTACSESKKSSSNEEAAISVTVENIESPSGSGYFSASGQIEAEQFANISTRIMGYVSKVYVTVGDQVRKGQSLIDVNNADMEAKKAQAQAGILQAEARFNRAEKELKRFQSLYDQKSASQKELDDITTQYDVAKAQLESAKQVQKEVESMLFYTNIKAPFSGRITSKSIKVGDMTKPGQHLMSIEAPEAFVGMAMVSETNIPYVKENDSVEVFVKSNETTIKGLISEISTSSQNSGGQYLVKIKLDIPENTKLYSGMFISVVFPSLESKNTQVSIPKTALVQKGDLNGIYTVSASNTAILRWLKLGRSLGDRIEVLSGLTAGEQVILSAEGKIYNGVNVTIK